ncbi:hypothetical protein [Pseudorhodoferax sp.]|uniref:hypothetical protein n=1 Tax=Pseudorhodoferax sp. TaxID=1993553 RepID=UPI002DD6741F|nr:hypothetical protein [Pseudorhodoferax sp.]
MQKLPAWLATLALCVIAVALCLLAGQGWRAHAVPDLSARYHAVALTNGQVFFGRLDSLDGDYVVLREVYYIQSRQNPDTRAVANVLIKRGGEAHAPDRMLVGRAQVQLIEPVGADSQVAQRIAEQVAAAK